MNGLLIRMKLALLSLVGVAMMGLGYGSVPSAAEPQKPSAKKMEKPAAKAETKPAEPAVKERTISGQVLGADGKPIVAELTLVWISDKPQPLGKTKADGTFEVTLPIARKDAGGWLVAKAAGHGIDFLPHGIDYLPRSMTASAEVKLKLSKERPIRGRLLDQQGKPVAGATVVASRFSAYDSDASADAHLKLWVTDRYQYGSPPDGDRNMWFSEGYVAKANPDGRSPYSATTDEDGRYEIAGIGAGQLVTLRVRGIGVADKEIVTLNRAGFDPRPVNKAAKDNEMKGYSFGGKWVLYGPEPAVVMEQEKIIRGKVTDQAGKPRSGVIVAFSRPNKRELNPDYNQAVTDKDGKYEIRGARKHKGYMVECDPDPQAGLMQCQAFADDTIGYEPITIDLKCAKGVVITGTVKNKVTGAPVAAQLYVAVLANNPFVKKYPPFLHSASMSSKQLQTDKAGRFRVVTISGPVILMASTLKSSFREDFKPSVADPKYPDYFRTEISSLMFHGYEGGRRHVQGCWCKVIDAKDTDKEITMNIDLEPATKMSVKVVDGDGKPVMDTHATGITHVDFDHPSSFPETATLTLFNVEPKASRLVAVIHQKRKLVGTATVKPEDKNPVVKLGAGGSVTGRAVDAKGKPLAGVSVHLSFYRREVAEAYKALKKLDSPTTDANGEFRIDTLFPGQEFRFYFTQGKKRFGPDFDKAPKHTIEKHGDTLKLGDLKLEPAKNDEGN